MNVYVEMFSSDNCEDHIPCSVTLHRKAMYREGGISAVSQQRSHAGNINQNYKWDGERKSSLNRVKKIDLCLLRLRENQLGVHFFSGTINQQIQTFTNDLRYSISQK